MDIVQRQELKNIFLRYKANQLFKRQVDVDIVQRQESALAAKVGKVKAARNVLPRKDAGELTTNALYLVKLI